MIFYRNYKYSPLATMMSALTFAFGAMMLIGGAALVLGKADGSLIGGVILLVIGALFGYEFFTHKLTDKVAEKNGKKNIESKARYGLLYCNEHPESYEYILSVNEAFAKKYVRQEDGKIVKRKKVSE